MSKNCESCVFYDKCASYMVCHDYCSILETDDMDELIEAGREEYRNAWFEYIDEDND